MSKLYLALGLAITANVFLIVLIFVTYHNAQELEEWVAHNFEWRKRRSNDGTPEKRS